jgi:hypothetical protein
MNKNTHGYMTVWYTKGIYVCFVNCFVVILPHQFVVSEVTLTVATRRSASGHGVSVLKSVTGRVHLIPLFKNY